MEEVMLWCFPSSHQILLLNRNTNLTFRRCNNEFFLPSSRKYEKEPLESKKIIFAVKKKY